MVAVETGVGKAVRFWTCFEGVLTGFADGVQEEEESQDLNTRKDGSDIN